MPFTVKQGNPANCGSCRIRDIQRFLANDKNSSIDKKIFLPDNDIEKNLLIV